MLLSKNKAFPGAHGTCLRKVLGNHCWLLSKALRAVGLWDSNRRALFQSPFLKVCSSDGVYFPSCLLLLSFSGSSPTYKMWTLSLLPRLHLCCLHPPSDLSPCPCSVAEMTTRLPCPPAETYGQWGTPRPGPLHVGGVKRLRSGRCNVWLRKTTSEILHVLWQMVVY